MFVDIMRRELCALASTLKKDGVRLYVGGGYGLWLKADHLAANAIETLREVPVPRTTQDIDLFLGVEVITDPMKTDAIREALEGLGHQSVPGAEHYQFSREITTPAGGSQTLKIDLLAPRVEDERVRVDARRIRPRESHGLHAHVVPEAETLEEFPFELVLDEDCAVFIPHPLTFLVMKLFALRDRLGDESRSLSRYHAYDVFTIVAMTTVEEWAQAREIRNRFSGSAALAEAKEIVRTHFDSPTSMGVIRLQEHVRLAEGRVLAEEVVTQFLDDLRTLLGSI